MSQYHNNGFAFPDSYNFTGAHQNASTTNLNTTNRPWDNRSSHYRNGNDNIGCATPTAFQNVPNMANQQPLMQQPLMQQPLMQQPLMQQPLMQQPLMQQPWTQQQLLDNHQQMTGFLPLGPIGIHPSQVVANPMNVMGMAVTQPVPLTNMPLAQVGMGMPGHQGTLAANPNLLAGLPVNTVGLNYGMLPTNLWTNTILGCDDRLGLGRDDLRLAGRDDRLGLGRDDLRLAGRDDRLGLGCDDLRLAGRDDRLGLGRDDVRNVDPRSLEELNQRLGAFLPRVGVCETQHEMLVTAELPGVDQKEVEVIFHNGVLTIRGEKRLTALERKADFYSADRIFGEFSRSIRLVDTLALDHIDQSKITAKCENGLLVVALPKVKQSSTCYAKVGVAVK